jgi:Pyrimidine dimer DNA glycosylase
MQTFLPYASFQKSAACLDNRRLGKQRVEALQILNVLEGKTAAWKHHPAVLMWRGYEKALRQYLRVVILEWKRRGFRNTMRIPRHASLLPQDVPWWMGGRRFHSAHRSNLLRKDIQHYGQMGWKVNPDLPRYWPVTIAALRAKGLNVDHP